MNMSDDAVVTVYRFDPTLDKEPRHETYKIPHEAWNGHMVIDVIRYVYENHAPGLSFREPCHLRLCGCCTVMVNKKPVLACSSLATKEMLIEPLTGHRVIKDLAVEL